MSKEGEFMKWAEEEEVEEEEVEEEEKQKKKVKQKRREGNNFGLKSRQFQKNCIEIRRTAENLTRNLTKDISLDYVTFMSCSWAPAGVDQARDLSLLEFLTK